MNRFKFSALAIAAILASTSVVLAQSFSFVEIAGTGAPVPGTGGTYTSLGLPTADRDLSDAFYFEAQSSNGIDGVYDYPQFLPDETLNSAGLIANTTMSAPTGGKFTSFSDLSSGFRDFGFVAQDSNGGHGVYVGYIGIPTAIVLVTETGSSPVPGYTFSSFQGLSISGYGEPDGPVAANGEILTDSGVYSFSVPAANASLFPPATITQIATTTTTPAGASGPFSAFGPPSYKARESDNVGEGSAAYVSAIRATAGGVQGIYNTFGFGTAQLLVNTATLIPSGTGHYTSFGNPVVSSSEIAFAADYTTSTGIQQGIFSYGEYLDPPYYVGLDPQLYQILATGQLAPDSGGAHFASFGTIALGVGGGLFVATLDDGVEGLYSFYDLRYEAAIGPLQFGKVLDTTETLDGKSIADIEISSEADTNGGYAFRVDFTDGSQGIFTTPEPASLSLFALPMWLVSRRRRLI